MAEAVVGLLIGKIGAALAKEATAFGASLLCKEVSALKVLFGEIRKAESELEMMKAYLHDIEKLKDTDETTGVFIKKIRNLAFQIEDVVDEFSYKFEDNKHGGFAAKMKKRIQRVRTWDRLAGQLKDINTHLVDAARQRVLYAMPGTERYAGGSNHADRSFNRTVLFARGDDLVDVEENTNKLKQWLVGNLQEKCKITTVWGMGGIGKTTLVDRVYNSVKMEFDAAAWVTVSRTYQLENLLRKIAREFGISVDGSNMEMRSLVDVIHNHLEGKRFILVLDDVWEKEVWINNLMQIFPTNCISRFVLTTRKIEVASLSSPNCALKLEPLGGDQSWELFCKLAFRSSDDKKCPLELMDLAKKFLLKCQGLPLAIVCIARLLSCKAQSYSAWKYVYEEIELHSIQNVIPSVDIIIMFSLEDLPYELKNCFLHCAMFPEDYTIVRETLILHWITAGFIRRREKETVEQVADSYLSELVNRSLLQVVQKNGIGGVKLCQMHDVIRHLALEKAETECFAVVYDGQTVLANNAHRLSIQSTDVAALSASSSRHLRAIHAFIDSDNILIIHDILESAKLLSTLDLTDTKIKTLPDVVFRLFNLRFLGLRGTGIESLPEAIGRLQNLEVLDAQRTALQYLPKEVAKLKKLRHLKASRSRYKGNIIRPTGIKLPREVKKLTGLHTLMQVLASTETLHDVEALVELRTFGICNVASDHSLTLCSAIRNMRNLNNLTIQSNEYSLLPIEELRLPETLSVLSLEGWLEQRSMHQTLRLWSHLSNLAVLYLYASKLDEDSFAGLDVLPGLCTIYLTEAYDGNKLYFRALSFPRLQELHIIGAPQLKLVEIAEGALRSLVLLRLRACPELKCLPHGIEYLTALEELFLEDTADELIDMLKQEPEEQMKMRHIGRVVVRSTEGNIWKRNL